MTLTRSLNLQPPQIQKNRSQCPRERVVTEGKSRSQGPKGIRAFGNTWLVIISRHLGRVSAKFGIEHSPWYTHILCSRQLKYHRCRDGDCYPEEDGRLSFQRYCH